MHRKKVLITGVTGQDGSYMCDYLLKNGLFEVFGAVRRVTKPNYDNLKKCLSCPEFKIIEMDITDPSSVSQTVSQIKPDYFINFAANSFVGNSWDMPVNHFNTNAVGVLNCLEAIRQHAPKCRFYNAGCYDKDTKIVTKDGVKDVHEVSEGDLVLSLNPETSRVEYKPITKIIKYHYNGDMLHFIGRGKDLMVTPNHKMFYQGKKDNLLKCRADEFINKSSVNYPKPKPFDGKHLPEYTDLSEFIPEKKFNKNIEPLKILTKDLLYLIGIYIGDGSSNILEKNEHRSPWSVRQESRDSLGRFSAVDIKIKRDIKYSTARCVLDIPESDPAFKKVVEILDRNNINWSLHNQCDITFFSWGLYHFFDQCGHKSNQKQIPNWVFELDSSLQFKVYEGLMDSDGCLSRKSIEQTSKVLAEQLLVLGANIGLRTSMSSRSPRESKLKDGRIIKGNHTTYTVRFSDKNICYKKKIKTGIYCSEHQYKTVPYNDYVWCLEVQDNHNFMVIRNGKTLFCGNSSEEFGNVVKVPQDESHPLRPRSPYGASKCSARHLVKVYRESHHIYAVQGWLFNHESERRGEEFVTQKIASGVGRIYKALKKGEEFDPILLGNLDAKRDWSHAEDFMSGVWAMLNQEAYSAEKRPWEEMVVNLKEFVLASGETHTVREFVEKAFAIAGIEGEWKDNLLPTSERYVIKDTNTTLVRISPDYYRPAEVDLLLGDPTKAKEHLNWKPIVSFDTLVERMVKNKLK